MDGLRIVMDGTPVAYSRPRFRSKRQPKGAGTPQAQRALLDLTRLVAGEITRYRQRGGDWDPTKPVMVSVDLVFPRPKSEGGRGRGYGRTVITVKQVVTESHEIGTADVDNLAKLVLEGLQHGGAVENDRLVVSLYAWKRREILWRS
jgi:Holliday junction resolvase RusA-like endonuclease